MPVGYCDSLRASKSSIGFHGDGLISSGGFFLPHPSLLLGSARGATETVLMGFLPHSLESLSAFVGILTTEGGSSLSSLLETRFDGVLAKVIVRGPF